LDASLSLRETVNASETTCFRDISSVRDNLDFRQTFVTAASWDKDELVSFWGQRVKGQGHIIAAERPALDADFEFSFLVNF